VIDTPQFWQWWILALGLLVVEVFAPGAFFLWFGVSAGLVGFIVLLAPGLGWQYQVAIFAVAAIIAVAAWRQYRRAHPRESEQPLLNRRGQQYVNRQVRLDAAITNGFGRMKVDDTTWRVEGPDMPVGTLVEIFGVDGTTLKVRQVSP
jgi:hypothetical protein